MAGADEHIGALLKLSIEERARAARLLLESIDDEEADEGAEEAWTEEIERRLARIDSGEATFLTLDQAVARLRRRRER